MCNNNRWDTSNQVFEIVSHLCFLLRGTRQGNILDYRRSLTRVKESAEEAHCQTSCCCCCCGTGEWTTCATDNFWSGALPPRPRLYSADRRREVSRWRDEARRVNRDNPSRTGSFIILRWRWSEFLEVKSPGTCAVFITPRRYLLA